MTNLWLIVASGYLRDCGEVLYYNSIAIMLVGLTIKFTPPDGVKLAF